MNQLHNISICVINGTEEKFVFPYISAIWAASSATTFSIFGVSFNLLTILSLLNHTPVRKHVTTPFVISLAFSDLIFSGAILPMMAIRFFKG